MLVDSFLKAWINKLHAGGIFCDQDKAFGCVSHEILIMNCSIMDSKNKTVAD
jgi:hypothetical protein